jgi:hypothetical protein
MRTALARLIYATSFLFGFSDDLYDSGEVQNGRVSQQENGLYV